MFSELFACARRAAKIRAHVIAANVMRMRETSQPLTLAGARLNLLVAGDAREELAILSWREHGRQFSKSRERLG